MHTPDDLVARIVVATHQPAEVPDDGLYLPVHVGAANAPRHFGIQRDDDGESISGENFTYCELTGLFWAWRNLEADFLGLNHYRRYFVGKDVGPRNTQILSESEIREVMSTSDLMVASPRNYVIETVASHYRHAHVADDLEVLKAVVTSTGWPYAQALDQVLRGRRLSLYNMLVGRRDVVDEYCGWLFAVLGEVHQGLDLKDRDPYQQRALGYLGERLLNVWLVANPSLSVAQRRVVNTEGEALARKGVALVRRKLAGHR